MSTWTITKAHTFSPILRILQGYSLIIRMTPSSCLTTITIIYSLLVNAFIISSCFKVQSQDFSSSGPPFNNQSGKKCTQFYTERSTPHERHFYLSTV